MTKEQFEQFMAVLDSIDVSLRIISDAVELAASRLSNDEEG